MICEICQTEFNHKKEMPSWVDRSTHEVILISGDRNYLTLMQWRILGVLWRRRNYDFISADGILTALSIGGKEPEADSLKVLLTKLRKAIAGRAWIKNTHGIGWRLIEDNVQDIRQAS